MMQKEIILDLQQIAVGEKLQQLALDLENDASEGFFKKIISTKNQSKKFLYLW